jgi:hypothetical protein
MAGIMVGVGIIGAGVMVGIMVGVATTDLAGIMVGDATTDLVGTMVGVMVGIMAIGMDLMMG